MRLGDDEGEEFASIPPPTGSVMDMQDHGKEEDSQIKSEIFEHIVDIERELIRLQKSYSGDPAKHCHIETLIDLLTTLKKGIKTHDYPASLNKKMGFDLEKMVEGGKADDHRKR